MGSQAENEGVEILPLRRAGPSLGTQVCRQLLQKALQKRKCSPATDLLHSDGDSDGDDEDQPIKRESQMFF
jgi:hypothetical protein